MTTIIFTAITCAVVGLCAYAAGRAQERIIMLQRVFAPWLARIEKLPMGSAETTEALRTYGAVWRDWKATQ